MKLAIVCARNPRKLTDTVSPSDAAARDLCSSRHHSQHQESCSDRSISQTSTSTSRCKHIAMHAKACVRHKFCNETNHSNVIRRDDVWSCGVCYEEICCPFTLPCGKANSPAMEALLAMSLTMLLCRSHGVRQLPAAIVDESSYMPLLPSLGLPRSVAANANPLWSACQSAVHCICLKHTESFRSAFELICVLHDYVHMNAP